MNNVNNKTCPRYTKARVCGPVEACDTCNIQSDPLYLSLPAPPAAASCEVTVADSLQVTAINKTEINCM